MHQTSVNCATTATTLHNAASNLVDHLHLGYRSRSNAAGTSDRSATLPINRVVVANPASGHKSHFTLPTQIGPIFPSVFFTTQQVALISMDVMVNYNLIVQRFEGTKDLFFTYVINCNKLKSLPCNSFTVVLNKDFMVFVRVITNSYITNLAAEFPGNNETSIRSVIPKPFKSFLIYRI